MKRIINAGEGQTLLDIAIQYCGNVEVAIFLSELNGISITKELAIGEEIFVPAVLVEDRKVVSVFADKNLIPASDDSYEPIQEGIGFWMVNLDFKVS